MARQVDVDISFGGTAETWRCIAELLGITTGRLEMDGMERHLAPLVRGDGSRLRVRKGRTPWNRPTCPIALALARAAGFDPAAILLLGMHKSDITVRHPFWRSTLTAGSRPGRNEIAAPVAPGVLWNTDVSTVIHLDHERAGIPHAVADALKERMRGRPLREVISHPLLDTHPIVVDGVEVIERTGVWMLWLSGMPAHAPLSEITNQEQARWRNA